MFRERGGSEFVSLPVSQQVASPPIISPELRRDAEAKQRYVAIYIIWVVGEAGFMVGTTRSPREMPTQAERFNKRAVDFRLLWCPSQEIADRLLEIIKPEIKPYHTHGNWYDHIPHETAVKAIELTARQAKVNLFTTEDREQRLIEACSVVMSEQKKLEAAKSPQATRPAGDKTRPALGQVVQFPAGKR